MGCNPESGVLFYVFMEDETTEVTSGLFSLVDLKRGGIYFRVDTGQVCPSNLGSPPPYPVNETLPPIYHPGKHDDRATVPSDHNLLFRILMKFVSVKGRSPQWHVGPSIWRFTGGPVKVPRLRRRGPLFLPMADGSPRLRILDTGEASLYLSLSERCHLDTFGILTTGER